MLLIKNSGVSGSPEYGRLFIFMLQKIVSDLFAFLRRDVMTFYKAV